MTKGLDDFDRGFVSAYLHREHEREDRYARFTLLPAEEPKKLTP